MTNDGAEEGAVVTRDRGDCRSEFPDRGGVSFHGSRDSQGKEGG